MKEPITLQAACSKIALLYASKLKNSAEHFEISTKIFEAISSEKVSIKETLRELDADRKKRKFEMSKMNFYIIKKHLMDSLNQEKSMSEAQVERLNVFIKCAISNFIANIKSLTIPTKGKRG